MNNYNCHLANKLNYPRSPQELTGKSMIVSDSQL